MIVFVTHETSSAMFEEQLTSASNICVCDMKRIFTIINAFLSMLLAQWQDMEVWADAWSYGYIFCLGKKV